ncbi:MAG: D-hexose-6-phosphate mutarotase [Pseudomonadota bacterium]
MTAIAETRYGDLPAICITSADGAEAIVTLYGAHLISWKTPDAKQRLFCSAKSKLDGSRAIRGGVPVIFPQFAERGDGMRHGFARVSTWRLAGSGIEEGAAFALFALTQADLAPAMSTAWPHGFALTLRVAIQDDSLALALEVRNTGADAFAFSGALHSYLLVDALGDIAIGGLQEDLLRISDKIDQIYFGIEAPVTLDQPAGTLTLTQAGFKDAVVWNPGAEDSAALADMDDDEYLRFVCIEPALIEPVTLPPGAAWRGAHQVRASSIP